MKKIIIVITIISLIGSFIYAEENIKNDKDKGIIQSENPIKYALASIIIPGSGLLIQNNWRGVYYFLIEAALIWGFNYYLKEFNEAYSYYYETGRNYNSASINLMLLYVIGGGIVGVWLCNIFDTVFETITINNNLRMAKKKNI